MRGSGGGKGRTSGSNEKPEGERGGQQARIDGARSVHAGHARSTQCQGSGDHPQGNPALTQGGQHDEQWEQRSLRGGGCGD